VVKKKGKTYGPYIYESYRDENGKVCKRYLGKLEEKKTWLKNKNKIKGLNFLFGIFFLILIFIAFWGVFNFLDVRSFVPLNMVGFAISENITEGDDGFYYSYYEEEIIEEFDKKDIDLEIKDSAKFEGKSINKNINKNIRMEFDTGEGNVRLYFDLLNYSEFIEEVEEIITQGEIEKLEEIEFEEDLRGEEGGVDVVEEESEETAEEIVEEDINTTETESEINNSIEITEENVTEDIEEEESEEVEVEEIGESEDIEDIAEEEEEEPSITGNIIRGLTGLVTKIEEFNIFEERVGSTISDSEKLKIKQSITIEEVREKVGELTEEELGAIEDEAVVEAEEFDIEVEKAEDDEGYKWGYKVKLNDLNFMAKIDVTSEENISIWNNNTLRIGDSLLSFGDLVKEGYTVRIETPLLEIGSEENGEIVVGEPEEVVEENVTEMEVVEEINDSVEIVEEVVGEPEEVVEENVTEMEVVEEINDSVEIVEEVVGEPEEVVVEEVEEVVEEPVVEEVEEVVEELVVEEVEEVVEELVVEEVEEVVEEPTITGNIIRGLIGFVTSPLVKDIISKTVIKDIEYENTITIYIERDFSNETNVSVGDIIYLDPTFVTIPDVTVGADLNNITAETNFTHLEISDVAPYDSLVLYLPFDGDVNDIIGFTAYDYTKENNDGTGNGHAVVNSTNCLGNYENCLQLDGVNDFVNVPDDDSLDGMSDLTISAWIRLNQLNAHQRIVSKWSGSAGRAYVLGISSGNNPVWGVDRGSNANIVTATDYTVTTNVWYHIVGTYNDADNTVRIYIDAVQNNTNVDVGGPINQGGEFVGIGIEGDGSNNYDFKGNIDEVMIFSSTLTPQQILDIYNNQSVRFKDPGQQGFGDQTVLNITAGSTQVQVEGDYEANLGSNINLSVGYYDGSWTQTAEQVFDGDNLFDIGGQSTNLTLNFTFHAGNSTNPFYSPILSSVVNALTVNVTGELTEITGCTNLTEADTTYTLQNDIVTDGTCLVVSASGITIDMVGYNITGDGEAGDYGILNNPGYDDLSVKDGYIYDFAAGIYTLGADGNFTNITYSGSLGTSQYGIQINNAGTNYIGNCNLSGISTATGVGVYITGSGKAIIENCVMSDNSGANFGVGILLQTSSNNVIRDSVIQGNAVGDVTFQTSINNTFINVTYDNEVFYGVDQLIRKWYFQTYVNDTNGNDVVANVTATNSSGSVEFSVMTNSSGWISRQEITDYIENGTAKYYYSNYTINATNSTYPNMSVSYNVTINENNVDYNFEMTAPPIGVINITYPTNTTYSNYVTALNYTHVNGAFCWYSIDSGTTNYSAVSAGTNWTGLNGNSSLGGNTWTVYCNDSAGNENSTSITFTVDNTAPVTSYDPTTDENGSEKTVTNIFVNVSASDAISNVSTFIDFDNSLVSWWRMDDVNGSEDPTDYLGVNNGTAVGTAAQTDSGKMGKAFEFDGNSDSIDTPFDGSEYIDLTISLWAKMDTNTGIDYLLDNSPGASGYMLRNDGTSVWFYVYNDAAAHGGVSTPDTLSDWTHVVALHNTSGNFIYIDGVYKAQTLYAATEIADSSDLLRIGAEYDNTDHFDGSIDDVIIFNRSLSATEVQGLYANTSTRYLEKNFTGLTLGEYTFKAYTQDSAGNVNDSLETRTVTITVDEIPPILTIVSPITQQDSTTTSFNISANEDLSWCGLSLDGSPNVTMTLNNATTAGLINYTMKDGNQEFVFTCNDTVGNYGTVSDTLYWDTENVTICRTLTREISYTQRKNIIDNGLTDSCMIFEKNNTSFDGNGFYISSDDNQAGVYSDQPNTTIKNCNISMGGGWGGFGIELLSADNSYIYNNTLNGQYEGLRITAVDNSIIENITANSNVYSGIFIDESTNVNVTNIVTDLNERGFLLSGSGYNLINITSTSSTSIGIYLENVANSFFYDFKVWNSTLNGIILDNSSGNTFERGYINESVTFNGLALNSYAPSEDSSNNVFKDMWINNSGINDIKLFIEDDPGGEVTNNTFLNVTYLTESVASTGELIRAWHYQAFVNDTNGGIVPDANLNYSNVTGINVLNLQTNASGWTPQTTIIEYVNASGVTGYYSNYSINIWNVTRIGDTFSYNVTGNNLNHVMTTANNEIFACGVVLTNGNKEYLVTNDLAKLATGWCIYINNNNISVNCQGNNITGSSSSGTEATNAGIYTDKEYSTINNCNIAGGRRDSGIRLTSSNHTSINNVTTDVDSRVEIGSGGLSNNVSFNNINLVGTARTAISLGVENSVFRNIYSANSISMSDDNNVFYDSTMASVTIVTALNNTFVNSTYASETGTGTLFRKWYYQVYVNNTDGDDMIANVSATNSSGSVEFSVMTNSSGLIAQQEITDYIFNGTARYYYDSVVSAVNSSYVTKNSTYNATADENNLNDNIQMSLSPNLTICGTLDQENTVYTLQNNLVTTGTCLTIGATNVTVDMNGFNITGDGGASDYGIDNTGGYNYTTVKDGEVYTFGTSVLLGANSLNNIFLNMTYDDESVASGAQLIRKWYYQVYVNDSEGNAVIANVTAYNASGVVEFSVMTNSSGWINKTAITYYVNNSGTTTYATPYNITATNASYYPVTETGFMFTGNSLTENLEFNSVPLIVYDGTSNNDSTTISIDNIFVNVTASDVLYGGGNVSTFIDFDSSLVSWWRMDDVNGIGDPTDYMGRNNGTAVADAAQTDSGKMGKGFSFDGNGDYIQLPTSSPSLTMLNTTISMWVKQNNLTNDQTFFHHFASGRQPSSFTIGTRDLAGSATRFGVTVGEEGNYYYWLQGTEALPVNVWHHIVFLVSPINVDAVYIDGVNQTNKYYTLNWTSTQTIFPPTGLSTVIGMAGISKNDFYFNGSIDDILIFNRSLSEAEIMGLYANKSSEILEVNYTSLTDGNHTFKAYTQDSAGNVNDSLETRTVTISLNTAPDNPTIVLNSTDGSNKTAQNLTCWTTISDPDTNTMNITVQWYKDDVLNKTIDYNNSYPDGTAFNATLTSGNTTKTDVWHCGIRLYDGSDYSDWVNSSKLTILNTLPVVTLVAPSDASSTYDRTPFFNWTGTDADGDNLTYDLLLDEVLFSGALDCTDNQSVSDHAVSNYTPTTDLSCLYDNGYYYNWGVRAQDDEAYGSWTENYTVNITANITIELIVDEIDFGDLNIWGAYNDTTDDNPSPLVIENKGNSLVNISINSTALFDNEPDNSSHFQFKIDENSEEKGAFNLTNSFISWFNVPITGSVTAISQLNYVDSNDTAEIDFNVSSPVNEVPGDKSALVLFTSSLGE